MLFFFNFEYLKIKDIFVLYAYFRQKFLFKNLPFECILNKIS